MPRSHGTATPDFDGDGARLFRGAVAADLPALRATLEHLPVDRAGIRIRGLDVLRPFLAPGAAIGSIAAHALGPAARPVRAILFDKSPGNNWSLAWHQDRTIAVRRKRDVNGFGPWTIKDGMQHVAPPFDVLARMITLRVHLDHVPESNAPLLIAPGSHRCGRIPVGAIADVVRQCGVRACMADAGDIWLYATPILHASETAARPAHRRVLQLDYAADDLPGGLEWLGI